MGQSLPSIAILSRWVALVPWAATKQLLAQVYLIIRDLAEAQYVCDYILHGGDKQEFLQKFSNATSQGRPGLRH